MGHTWISQAEFLFLVGTCTFAWLKGGQGERAGALVILIGNLVADLGMLVEGRFPETFEFGCDFVFAFVLLVLAIRYSSIWLGAAMFLQSIGLALHGLELAGDGIGARAYITCVNAISMLTLLSIVAATFGSWRRRVRAAAPTRLATDQLAAA